MDLPPHAGRGGARFRSPGRRWTVHPAVVVGLATTALAVVSALGWSDLLAAPGRGPAALGPIGLLGLAARGAGGNEIERLTAKIERFEAGEDVTFSTDRDDELGDLYAAVDRLAAAASDRRADDRAGHADGRGGDDRSRDRADRRALERQASLLDAIFEQVPINLYVKDAEGRHVRTSTPYLRESYEDVDESWFHGKTDLDIYPEALARESYEDDMRVVETGEPVVDKVEYDPADDEWVLTSKVPWRDDDGDIQGLIGTSQYVTEQIERERELEETKETLGAQTRTLRRLYEISADREASFDEKVRRVLDLGRERLGTDAAFLSAVDPDEDRFEMQYATGAAEGIEPGSVTPLSETYCQSVLDADGLVAVADVAADDRIDQDVYDRWGHECYVGGKVTVEDDLYGTLCFVDPAGCESAFTADERTFVELACQWVGYELERRQREQALREYREFTDDVLDAIDDVFYLLDDDWTLRRWNQSLVDVSGYADGEIGGMSGLDFFPEEEAETIAAALEDIDRREGIPLEADVQTKDGERVPYELVAAPLEDPDGNRVIAGIGRDISERRERERELEAIVENTTNIIFIKDRNGVYQFVNDAAASTFGMDPAEIVGKTDEELFDSNTLADLRAGDRRVLEAGETVTTETKLRIDGEDHVFLDNKYPYRDADGEILGIMGISQDITDRKEREEELARTKDLLAQAGRLASIGGWEVDFRSDPPTTKWTDELYRIHDLPPDADVPVEDIPDLFHPEDRALVEEANRKLRENGDPYDIEVRLDTGDDLVKWVRALGEAVREDGETVKFRGTLQDVTGRKQRERELRETNERLNRLIEASPDAIVALDTDGTVDLWNPAAERIFGWTEAEAVGDRIPIVPAEADDEFERFRDRVLDGEAIQGVELVRQRKDGTRIDVNLSAAPLRDEDGAVVGIMAALEDITERKQRERELERTTDLLTMAGEMADVGGWSADITGEPPYDVRWTDKLYDVFEIPRDESPPSEDIFEYYHPEDRERHRDAVRQAFREGEGWDQELRIVTDEGTERWVRNIGEPVIEDGEPVGIRGSIQDVTERRERVQALRERERDLREYREFTDDILDAVDDIFYIVDETGSFRRWNRSVREVTGYTDEEIAEMHPTELVVDDHATDIAERMAEVFETGAARTEASIRTKDGEEIHYEFAGSRVEDPDGRPVLAGIGRDISERKEYERELERRMAAIETSVDGIGILDAEGEYVFVNQAHAHIYGYDDPQALVGETWAACYGPAVRSRIEETIIPELEVNGHWRGELVGRRADGSTFPQELSLSVLDNGDFICVVRDVSERKERERELRRTRELLQQAQHIAGVGGWEVDLTAEPYEVTWTDGLFRLYDLPPDTDVDLTVMLEFLHPEDRSLVREVIDEVIATGESYDMETRLVTAAGEEKWVRAIGEPVFDGDRIVALRGSVQDVTAQKERELAMASLHEATRGLLGTETDEEAAQLVLAAAEDVLEVACVGIYLLDAESNRLEPAATTAAFEERCGGARAVVAGDENSTLWNCFVSGSPTVVDDTTGGDAATVFGGGVEGGLLVPLGEYGVFVVATEAPTVDDETRRLVETLVATTEAAFDRIATETALRERDAELEARNRRLQRQIAITDVIRRVDESLIGANSREAIEAAVTDRLAATEDVTFAWVGHLDPAGDHLEPRAWAGAGGEYLDAVSLATESGTEPAVTAAETREPVVVSNVVDHLQTSEWAKRAVAADLHSLVAVPLVYEGYFYGVLGVYADEPDAFGDLEREVFAELGGSIAHSINAVETQRALHADALVELTLGIDDPADPLGRLARGTGGRVVYEGLATHSETESRLFVTVENADPDLVAGTLADMVSVRSFRVVSEEEGLYELAIEGETLPSRLVRHGARPRSITVTAAETAAVVDVPTSTDVREFVAMLREANSDLELEGRRTVERATRTRRELVSSLLSELTDRQLEVLRTAFFAGFFEWPRTSTGEDVAEMLGVTQPTVNRHLRLAQQRVLGQLFDGATGDRE